jgi:CelD/BcsL family acetyltransferase involved in cellulose biosynthesis
MQGPVRRAIDRSSPAEQLVLGTRSHSNPMDVKQIVPNSLTVRRHTDWATVEPLVSAWNQLRSTQDGSATVFAGYGFTRALWKSFGQDSALELLSVTDGDELVGLMALAPRSIKQARVKYSEIGFFRNHHTIRNAILMRPGMERAVLNALFETLAGLRDWDVMFLENIPKDDATLLSPLDDALAAHRLRRDALDQGRRLCFLPVQDSWEAYRKSKSGNFRQQLKKFQRRASELGRVEFRCASSRDEIAAALPEVFALRAKSWQGLARTEEAEAAADQAFDLALLQELDDIEVGDLWLMSIDGRLVASLRMLGDAQKRYVHTMHYDPTMKDVAPGMLLFEQMLAAAWAAGLSEVDFHGNSAFFRRWTTHQREHVTTRIYGPSSFGRLLQIGRRVRHWSRKPVEATDADSD